MDSWRNWTESNALSPQTTLKPAATLQLCVSSSTKTNCQTLSIELGGHEKVEGVQSLKREKSVKSRGRRGEGCRPSQPSRPFPRECQTWKRSGREVR